MSRTVAVVFGGVSNENEISVITGTMAANILRGGGDNVVAVYISREGEFFTGGELCNINTFKSRKYLKCPHAVIARGGIFTLNKRGKIRSFTKIDCAVNCCHGGFGEGGGVCGLFLCAGIPFAGSGIFESAAFMDKLLTKTVLSGLGIRRLPYTYARNKAQLIRYRRLGFPLMVKPATLGSSIGISRVDDEKELISAAETAFLLDSAIIIEPYVKDRREINCAAYFAEGRVNLSDCEEVLSDNEILSFEDKYQGGGKRVYPADIPEQTAQKIKKITAFTFARLNMRGIARFDYILSGDEIYLSEVNTVPGSLAYYLFSPDFKSFYAILDKIINQAIADFTAASQKKIIKTGILDGICQTSKGCK